jgi:hypothetical protein
MQRSFIYFSERISHHRDEDFTELLDRSDLFVGEALRLMEVSRNPGRSDIQ